MKYFEDFVAGEEVDVGEYRMTADDLGAFALAWDPQPHHVDADAAARSTFGGVIASGVHLLAITVRMLVTLGEPVAIVAALGWDDIRFRAPVRAGDTLRLRRRCLDVRPSSSNPQRGIVRNELLLTNQEGVVVLSYRDSLLVLRKPSGDVVR